MNGDLPTPDVLRAMGATSAAAFWLERLQRQVAAQDDAAFEAWRNASPAHAAAWERARDLWDVFEEPDAEDVLGGVRREALALRERPARTPAAWYLAAGCVAAVVVGGVLLSGLGWQLFPQGARQVAAGPDLHAFGSADYETGDGQRLAVRLEDGSQVRLSAGSAVDVAYLGGERLVRLTRGEAEFEVTHDAAHPFRVAAGGRIVSDLGTRFTIRLRGEETRIRLEEGSLGVTIGDDPQRVTGKQTILVPGQELITRAGRTNDVVASLPEGAHEIVQFENATLAQAVAQLNHHAKVQLVVKDPRVAAMRISGGFKTGDSVAFAETLTALYPVRTVRLSDGTIEIVPARGR